MIERQRLPAPSEVRAVHREGEIILGWSYPEEKLGEVSEFIVMKSEGTAKFKKAAGTRDLDFTDRDFKIGTGYAYKIFTKDQKGKPGEEPPAISIAPANVPPPPANISVSYTSDTAILSWTHPNADVFFNVYGAASKGSYPLSPAKREPLRQTSFTAPLDTGKTVYYSVRAVTSNGDESSISEEIEAGPNSLVPSPPTGLEASVMEDRVVLIWGENPEKWVRGYRVYRAENGGEFIQIGETRTPSFTDKRTLSKTVRYKVRALAPALEGPFSEPVEVAPLISAP